MSRIFAPATPVEHLVHAGDVEGTIDCLRPLSAAERNGLRRSLVGMNRLMREAGWRQVTEPGLHWGSRAEQGQERAVAAALLLCGTAAEVAESRFEAGEVIALARHFDLPCLPGLADALLAVSPLHIRKVQALVAAGLVGRPDSDDYALGLISLPRSLRRGERFEDLFDADPGLAQALLRMFGIEGTADTCLASIDKYNSVDNSWARHLCRLCDSGALSRATLLDRTLSALERDWPQYRSGWFSRFHAELAPGVEELRVNAGRYLQLCHSRIPPTVSLALEALARLEKAQALAPSQLVMALRPVMACGNKRQLESALALLDRCRRREPALEEDARLAACPGLVHEAPEMQARIIKWMGQGPLGARVQADLGRHLPGIAPSNRAALLTLLGESGTTAEAPAVFAAIPLAAGRASPLDDSRSLPPLDGLDALVRAIAHVFENDQDTDTFELALAGLVAAAPVAAGDLARFGPVLKRAEKVRKPLATALARLLVFVLSGERRAPDRVVDNAGFASQVHASLARRIDELMALAGQRPKLPPLSTPTHRRGFIAPSALIERVHRFQQRGVRASTGEQVLALLRLAGPFSDEHRRQARALAETPFARALRYALGDDVAPGYERELFLAAARVRRPGADDERVHALHGDPGPDGAKAARYAWEVSSRKGDGEPVRWYHSLVVDPGARAPDVGDLLAVARHPAPACETSWGALRLPSLAGNDPGLVGYSGTWVPGDMEAFFAEGVRALGNNLDWWEAHWQDKAYLEPLLDPTVAPGAMGTLLLACALGAKEPGQSALAVDALVALHARSDLDVPLLAATLRRLLCTPLGKAARCRKAFDAALRIHPELADTLVTLMSAAIPFNADPAPKDLAQWLELLRELLSATGGSLPADARQGIAGLKLGGRGKTLQKQLLAG